ncbi:hypothetical protein BC829DRAFT_262356 [Chytridium lagenaria]|nr:hypothetical protein BC829DRAFT_262356 [Chytridium lagenaria]
MWGIIQICWRRQKELKGRMSLQLMQWIAVAGIGVHGSYIQSMFYVSRQNCSSSVVINVAASLLRASLTSCLGIHAFLIQIMRINFQQNAVLIYLSICLSISLLLSITLFSSSQIAFTEFYGCWFNGNDDVASQFAYLYIPLFVSVILNVSLAIALSIHLRVWLNYTSQMSVESPSSFISEIEEEPRHNFIDTYKRSFLTCIYA